MVDINKEKEDFISYELLNELVSYDEATGALFWKERGVHLFKGSKRGAVGDAKHWNKTWAGKEAFCQRSRDGYSYGHIFDVKYYKHRIIWLLHYGKWPENIVDHLNGDKGDNKIENLQLSSHSENQKNTFLSSRNKSGQVGVIRNKLGKFEVHVSGDYLGVFEIFDDAVQSRKEAEKIYGFSDRHGEQKNV